MSCGTLASISWDAAHLTCHDWSTLKWSHGHGHEE
jgi:hypothetical protein